MKIIFSKQELLKNLSPAMGSVCTKNTITSIEGVLIETLGGNRVRLSTYDMNKGVRVIFDAISVIEEGSYIINAQRLLQIVRVMPDAEVMIEVDEGYNTKISSGKSSFSLFALRGSDFPTLPELSGSRGFEMKADLLRDMINKVMHSVADQDSRPVLCGAYFKLTPGKFELISCDSYTLSRVSVSYEMKSIGEEDVTQIDFIIPGHALNELVRILGENSDKNVSFFLARKHAIIKIDNLIFFTRMIDGEYIDYERIMPKSQTVFTTLDRERLLEGLERANLVAEEKIQGSGRSYVKIKVSENTFSLTSSSINGKVYDEMPCTHTGEDIEIGFNCRYLINSVRAATGDNIVMTFKSPTQSITIEPEEKGGDETFFYMVLPVRMNG